MVLNLVDVDVDAVAGCVHPRPASVSILRHGRFDFLRYYRYVFIFNCKPLFSCQWPFLRSPSRCMAFPRHNRENRWMRAPILPPHDFVRVLVDADVFVTDKNVEQILSRVSSRSGPRYAKLRRNSIPTFTGATIAQPVCVAGPFLSLDP